MEPKRRTTEGALDVGGLHDFEQGGGGEVTNTIVYRNALSYILRQHAIALRTFGGDMAKPQMNPSPKH